MKKIILNSLILTIINIFPIVSFASNLSSSSAEDTYDTTMTKDNTDNASDSTDVDSIQITDSTSNSTEYSASERTDEQLHAEKNTKADISTMSNLEDILPGAKEPSRAGLYFILPLRAGIVHQPPAEQYIRAGSGYADLAIRSTSYESFNFSPVEARVNGWVYDEDSQTWVKYTLAKNKFNSNGAFLGVSLKLNYNIAIENLPEGTYYFQIDTTLKRNGLFLTSTYYSEFAKVIVLPENVATTDMDITAPEVILGGVDYPVSVAVSPYDTTTPIIWDSQFHDSTISDKLLYFPEKGQESELQLDNNNISSTLENSINTSTENPGFPLDIITEANNVDAPFIEERKQIFYGGLPAKISARNEDINWHLDTTALKNLDTVSEEVDSWSYEWEYFEHESNTVRNFTSKQGVTYKANSIKDIIQIGSNENYFLKIPSESTFYQTAYEATKNGKPLSVRLKITAKSRSGLLGSLFPSTQVIYSNRAELKILDNELTLVNVPSFNFGEIPINYIYEGSGDNDISSLESDVLEVSDTRINNSSDWALNAQLLPFKNTSDEVELNSLSQIHMYSNDETSPLDVNLQNDLIKIIQANESKRLLVNAGLSLQPNPKVIIKDNDQFTGQIVWTLVSSQIVPSSLE